MLLCDLPHMYHVCVLPHLPTTPIPIFFLHLILVPFVQPLNFCCTYIRLEKHVCFTSSYIKFDIYCHSPTHVWLKPHTPQYLLDSRSYLTLDPLLFRLAWAWKLFPQYLQLCNFPMVLGEHIYLHTTRNTWTVTEGQCSAQAEASVQNLFISRTARPNLRAG